jgi:murein DD-endopeptidase MepM/ murein hydrolase activator NlpD
MSTLTVFTWPIGTPEQRAALWPLPWYITMGFNQFYPANMGRSDIHPGDDFNLANFGDSGQPCYAAADGVVKFAGTLRVWGYVIIVEHELETGEKLYSRYAHLAKGQTPRQAGEVVARGDWLATIGDYGRPGPQDDHLHFDLCRLREMYLHPGFWPGSNQNLLLQMFVDPAQFIPRRLPREYPV